MSNALTALNKEYWASQLQEVWFKENVARALSDTHYEAVLSDGDTLNLPYTGFPQVQTYTKDTAVTPDSRYSTSEALSVDTTKIVPSYYDKIDKIQNSYQWMTDEATKAMKSLNNVIDQAVLGEYSNAGSDVYAADVGSSGATTAITLNTSAVHPIFAALARKLNANDIPQEQRFAVIGPKMKEQLALYIAGKDTSYADQVGLSGLVAKRFGFDIYYSNNVPFTATLGMATAPTALDTITINGAVLEFATDADVVSDDSYIGVLRGGTVDIDRAALTAAINQSGIVGTTYSDPDAENNLARWKLTKAGVVATNDNDTDVMTIVAYGDIAVSSDLSDGTDAWTSQQSHILAGRKGSIMLLTQKSPSVEIHDTGGDITPKLGMNILTWTLFGKKTPTRAADALVSAHINASAWT